MQDNLRTARPLLYLVFITVMGAFLLCLAEGALNTTVWLLLGSICFVSALMYCIIWGFELGDRYIFLIMTMLSLMGVIMLLRLKSEYGTRQVIWFAIGTLCFLAVCLVYRSTTLWNKLCAFYVGLSVALFVVTRFAGTVRNGSKNWIMLGEVSFQPSELIRILFVLTLAAVFTKPLTVYEGKNLRAVYNTHTGRIAAASAVSYLYVGFLVLQRDWGQAALFFMIYIVFLLVYGFDKRFLLANAALAAAGITAGYLLTPHIKTRIATWLHPFDDPSGTGYQITQSLFAIGEGGLAGRGIGSGSPHYIPEVHSDFIFSALCEETGVLGGLAIIMLYFVLVYRGFKIALSTTNEFNKAVAMGISAMFGLQTFIIIGGVIKLIPLTGITLPFISYGGSSLVTSLAALGILQGISSRGGDIADEI
ncbi:MAG: FtsW/RodA/SpoVE family cell cycle protein [Clostridia bacterium]|nr:FtsW/RodA/SpoVE family cell cycle protein [Clostridia bacterium]